MRESSVEQRITDLEIHVTHLQRLFDQLNEVAVQQSTQLQKMERELRELREQFKRLKTQQSDEPHDPFDEKPPHY